MKINLQNIKYSRLNESQKYIINLFDGIETYYSLVSPNGDNTIFFIKNVNCIFSISKANKKISFSDEIYNNLVGTDSKYSNLNMFIKLFLDNLSLDIKKYTVGDIYSTYQCSRIIKEIIKTDNMKNIKDFVNVKMFCLRNDRGLDLDCSIFTDKNIGGYGLGIRGNYFSEYDFNFAYGKIGDSLQRKLYTIDELEQLRHDLEIMFNKKITNDNIKELVVITRNSYCSSDDKIERKEKVFVEIDDLFK